VAGSYSQWQTAGVFFHFLLSARRLNFDGNGGWQRKNKNKESLSPLFFLFTSFLFLCCRVAVVVLCCVLLARRIHFTTVVYVLQCRFGQMIERTGGRPVGRATREKGKSHRILFFYLFSSIFRRQNFAFAFLSNFCLLLSSNCVQYFLEAKLLGLYDSYFDIVIIAMLLFRRSPWVLSIGRAPNQSYPLRRKTVSSDWRSAHRVRTVCCTRTATNSAPLATSSCTKWTSSIAPTTPHPSTLKTASTTWSTVVAAPTAVVRALAAAAPVIPAAVAAARQQVRACRLSAAVVHSTWTRRRLTAQWL